MRYLIVDDDPVIRKFLVRLLKTTGADCAVAPNHAEAMEHVGLADFDSALVDVNLGAEDGLDLAVLLRDMHRKLKIVVMSADPANERRVVEEGLGQLLLKPFTPDELRQSLHLGP